MKNLLDFSIKGFHDFLKSGSSLQLQSNFEFRWPLLFDKNSFLIDTLEVPEIDSTQGYMYLDGYQIPVLSTPRFTNTIRVSFWAEEPFLETYKPLFNELTTQEKFNGLYIKNQTDFNKNKAYIIPISTEEINPSNKNSVEYQDKAICLYDTRLKQITVDEHSASSQALMHINLTITFAIFNIVDITLQNKIKARITNGETEHDRSEKSRYEAIQP